MRKKLLCAIAGVSLAALALPVAAQATTEATPPRVAVPEASASSINWGTCASAGLQARHAQCAKVSVPLDWAKPTGTKIKIAISRIKHTVPASKYQGVMFVNPGGPGGSGLTLSVLGEYVPKYKGHTVGGAYDWIGFDPRGVGSSEPKVVCDDNYAGYNRPKYDPDAAFPYTTYNLTDPWPARTNGYTADCKANNDAKVLGHLTTRDVAKDMNSIRQKLGVNSINYYGFSYGTYLGQVYASLFPTHLRRTVFDGTVDPRRVWYAANLDQDVAFEGNMTRWFRWLAKYDSTYHLGDTGAKVRKLFFDTRDDLYENPVTAPGGKLGGSEWTDAFLYAGYYQSTWTDLADTFDAFINNDDAEALEASYLDASGLGDDNGYAVYLAVQCTDTAWPKSWSTWFNDNTKVAQTAPFETWSNAWYNEPCRHWPAPSRTLTKIDGTKTKNLLQINETYDAATPYPGSLEVRRRFPHSSLVAVVGGTTHSNSLNGNACVDNTIARFLYDGTRPTRSKYNHADKYCAPLPQPVPAAKQAAPGISKLLIKENMLRP